MNRNNIFKTSLLVIISLSTFIISCKKETITPTPTTATTPTTPTPGDADGVLAAVRTKISVTNPVIGTVSYDVGTAVALFGSTPANFVAGTFTDAGTVTSNTKTLTKQSNNSYAYQFGATDLEGIDYSSNVSWNVTGAGSIPAITKNLGNIFPTFPTMTNGSTVSRTAPFTITNDYSSNADSVIYVIATGNKQVKKTLYGSSTSCTFTASELSTLDASESALIQVNAYNLTSELISGKRIYYVNMATDNKMPSKVE
jgi:hypothetical protein